MSNLQQRMWRRGASTIDGKWEMLYAPRHKHTYEANAKSSWIATFAVIKHSSD